MVASKKVNDVGPITDRSEWELHDTQDDEITNSFQRTETHGRSKAGQARRVYDQLMEERRLKAMLEDVFSMRD